MRTIVLLFLCHGVWAQSQQAADPATLARVQGRVVNSVTGEPLRKAELMLHSGAGGMYTGVSDSNGQFIIEKVAPGDYNMTAQHQNYTVLDYGSPRPGVPGTKLSLTAGQSTTGLELKLVPFGVISGKVVDQDGDPVAGVPVMVMHWGFMRGGRQLMPSGGGASTNDRGEFRIYNLASGHYFLVARPPRLDTYGIPSESVGGRRMLLQAPEPPRESYTVTFYPSSLDVASASPVMLNAGQEVPGIDIQLRKSRTYTVQGKVAGFQKGRRYSLSLQTQDSSSSGNFGTNRASAVRQEDGTFAFHSVPPGRYTLIAMADNRVGARQEISVGDSDLDGMTVVLLDPGVVKGKVQLEPGVTRSSLKGFRISLTPVDGIPMNLPNANTGDDGTFGMEEVAADRYKVSCSPVEGAYLKTIRWNGQISNDGTVETTSGGTSTLEMVFAPTSAVIDGDVKTSDDKPALGVSVLLSPASGRESDFRPVMTDQNGHFAAKNIAPGSYTALATDATIYSMLDATLLKALAKVTTAVSVDENGHTTVSLKLVPEAVIEATQ